MISVNSSSSGPKSFSKKLTFMKAHLLQMEAAPLRSLESSHEEPLLALEAKPGARSLPVMCLPMLMTRSRLRTKVRRKAERRTRPEGRMEKAGGDRRVWRYWADSRKKTRPMYSAKTLFLNRLHNQHSIRWTHTARTHDSSGYHVGTCQSDGTRL